MSTFYLIRHGDKEKTMGDPPLSQLGAQQAELTAKILRQYPVTQIYTSPLKRTQQTAKAINKELNLPFATDERLKERMNWGDKKDETFEEFLKEWEKASMDRMYKPSHGDSAWATGEKLRELLLELESKHKNEGIIIVTHGGTIGDFLQNTFSSLTLAISPTGVSYVKILECSVTIIKNEQGKFTIQKIGDTSHLSQSKK